MNELLANTLESECCRLWFRVESGDCPVRRSKRARLREDTGGEGESGI